MKTNLKRWGVLLRIYAGVLIFLGAFVLASSYYKHVNFRQTELTEVMFYVRNGLVSAPSAGWGGSVPQMALYTVLMFAVLWLPLYGFWFRVRNWWRPERAAHEITTGTLNTMWRLRALYPILVLVTSLLTGVAVFNVPGYVRSLYDPTALYEKHYVDPFRTEIKPPAKKRNLIVIYLESIENTVASKAAGGRRDVSLIPELEKLAQDPNNVSFTHKKGKLGGSQQVWGTSWSLAGMVASMGGIPLKASIGNDGDQLPKFLPGARMLGDVLREHGYQQSLVMGTGPAFGGLDKLMTLHGDFKMLVPSTLKQEGRLPQDYHVWWGYEDRKMFRFAKEEAARLAASDKPFHLQMLVEDTHFPDGYDDPACARKFERQYDNVHACASQQTSAFLDWVKAQPFAKDTTVVVIGDHLGMQTPYYDEMVIPGYTRTTYNAIINPAVRPKNNKVRNYTHMDYYPTILAALGFQVAGEQLALGTNLFSNKPTLAETIGVGKLNQELAKQSSFYDNQLLDGVPAPR